ncbi:hypothetical protein DICPUDRAFT_149411 [Dictyostelium purpureum]|uniref:Uncharacterized protein n=1 Tax=Dictyostelium purpureum TaxID=5786 RepID=F0ZDN3_DICPU|nr:uncharacterized protein DICPUDRAFT_149411 [Dictyostelium purpureum]EGC37946.1 hypothetical protein DICPUDRAFT_149411 [Dictyostelium purpureum]|eukprot:XP_003285517.1 hypothetical protein DICPUDRAFT_149411 [Dictyostelium purpureum]
MTIVKCITSLNCDVKSNIKGHVGSGSGAIQMGNNQNSFVIMSLLGGAVGLVTGLLTGLGIGAASGLKSGLQYAVTSLIENPASVLNP